jgi:DNA-binding transcriptional LysR family regulator
MCILNLMDLRRLKTFATVAEHGTVSAAARILHITQPALSRQIGALESELGLKLFERAGRRLVLTPQGEQLLGDCQSLVTHAAALGERAQALRRGDIRVLRVAASALTIEAAFPEFLKLYAEKVPGVRLRLIEADAAEHFSMLQRGEAHLAINTTNAPQTLDPRLESYALPRFQLLAVHAPGYGIGTGETIEIGRLVRHPLLLLDQSYATRNVFDAACRLAAVVPNVFFESAAVHALVALAEAGHGVAVIPSILRHDRKRVRALRVTHRQQPLELTLAVLWDKRRTLPRHAESFSDLFAAYLREAYPVKRAPGIATPSSRAAARPDPR